MEASSASPADSNHLPNAQEGDEGFFGFSAISGRFFYRHPNRPNYRDVRVPVVVPQRAAYYPFESWALPYLPNIEPQLRIFLFLTFTFGAAPPTETFVSSEAPPIRARAVPQTLLLLMPPPSFAGFELSDRPGPGNRSNYRVVRVVAAPNKTRRHFLLFISAAHPCSPGEKHSGSAVLVIL